MQYLKTLLLPIFFHTITALPTSPAPSTLEKRIDCVHAYEPRTGDTCHSIAHHHNITVSQLIALSPELGVSKPCYSNLKFDGTYYCTKAASSDDHRYNKSNAPGDTYATMTCWYSVEGKQSKGADCSWRDYGEIPVDGA